MLLGADPKKHYRDKIARWTCGARAESRIEPRALPFGFPAKSAKALSREQPMARDWVQPEERVLPISGVARMRSIAA